jgi:radical SAM superfamily enzyme YgiQ (UPF0313 family)
VRVLLVNPKLPESFWSFRWALQEVLPGKRALNPPLGLATVAALCPPEWEVRIVDENVEALPLRPEADLIGVGGMGVQAPRQKQLLRYYRAAGYYTVAGGSYASLCPEEYEGVADTVVAGEAEYIWPRFCAEYARGAAQALYRETGDVRLEDSPAPRFELLKLDRYGTATLQLSRGCPFRCEFCDIIVMFGRRPRYKSTAQIGRELDALRRLGARKVFFVDDNFIGNKAVAKDTLAFLERWQADNGRSTRFGTEASINLAADDELMRRFRAAGFEWLFMGLETPDAEALRDAGKTQNCAHDLLESVRRIYSHGIEILAGFIVGFDRDTPAAFANQERFIRASGIMVAMVGMLTALPKTPLYERLAREGRVLAGVPSGDNTGLRTNIIPKNMSSAQLVEGYRRLYRSLLADRAIAERIRNKLAHFGAPVPLRREAPLEAARMVWNLLRRGIARGGPARAWHFFRSLPLTRPTLMPIAINDWAAGLAMRDYADRHLRAAAGALRAVSAERGFLRLKRALRRWRRQGRVRLAFLRAHGGELRIALQVSGVLDRALARRLARHAGRLLARTQARLVLSLEQARDAMEQRELDRLARQLGRYGDRALIVLGEGVREMLRLDAPAPAGFRQA